MSSAVRLPSQESQDERNEWIDSFLKPDPTASNLSLPTDTLFGAAVCLKDQVRLQQSEVYVDRGRCLTEGDGVIVVPVVFRLSRRHGRGGPKDGGKA